MESANVQSDDDLLKDQWYHIRIVHFINPHHFYFKYDYMYGSLEDEIDDLLNRSVMSQSGQNSDGYEPMENEIVVAFIPAWSRWIRAQVDAVINDGDSSGYVVWSLDHGIPWLMNKKHLRPLPKSFVELERSFENKLPTMTFAGGLSSCVPCRTQIVFDTLKSETVVNDEWDDCAVNEASKLINSATEVYFKPMAKYQNTIFGEIKLFLSNQREVNLTSHICAKDYAMLADSLIPETMNGLRTMSKSRYQNNKGQLSTRNTSIGVTMPAPKKGFKSVESSVSLDLNTEDKKILNWNEGNANNIQILYDLDRRFRNRVNEIVTVKAKSAEKKQHHGYQHGARSGELEATKLLSTFGSQLTIASEESAATSIVSNHEKRALYANRGIHTQNSLQCIPEYKQVTYCPAGYECDMYLFNKNNNSKNK